MCNRESSDFQPWNPQDVQLKIYYHSWMCNRERSDFQPWNPQDVQLKIYYHSWMCNRERSDFQPWNPQDNQIWEVGSQGLITLKLLLYFPTNLFSKYPELSPTQIRNCSG